MIKKLTFIIILSLEIVYCSTQNSFKLKIGNQEYIITANNINDTFEVTINNNTYDMTPLIYASYLGNLSLAKFSIENGANVNAIDKYDDTALGVASEKENLEMVKYLVENGADVNAKYKYGDTALKVVLIKENLEIAKYLIEHGADINTVAIGKTALIIASEKGNFDMVKYLVEKGADINAFNDWWGISALMKASRFGYLEIVKYLVENGADINAKDNNGWTALMYASTMGYSQIVKYLIEKGADKETESVNSQEPKLVEKYLFATLKGKIDGKHDITINIQISDVNSLTNGATAELTGNYHYDKFGKNIYFTKGTINKNSMTIEVGKDEVFNFKLNEATLNKILELKTDSKNITINGTWENKSKKFPCVINSASPLGGKLSEIYKYNISGEASYDRGYGYTQTLEYYGDALYSPSMNVSYFMETFYTFYFDTNVDKVDIKTLKNIMKGNFKKSISDDKEDESVISHHYSNDFRIRYFDNKILCLEEYVSSLQSTTYVGYNYTILSLETGKKLNNNFDLYTDLVDYSEEFAEFFKKEFIEYHDYRGHYEERYTPKPSYYKGYYLSTPFIFNNDGTITIYTDGPANAVRHLRVVKIDMKKLKPYIKKDSFYRYLFD